MKVVKPMKKSDVELFSSKRPKTREALVCEICGDEHYRYTTTGMPARSCFRCAEEAEVQESAQEPPIDLKELLARATEIQKRRWIAEYELGLIMTEQQDVGKQLEDAYQEIGIKSLRYGSATLYLARDFYVSPKDENLKLADIREDVVSACEEAGLGYMVKETVNAKTLSAFINECKKEKREVPDALTEILNIEPAYKVRIVGLGKANIIAQHQMERTQTDGIEEEDSNSSETNGSNSTDQRRRKTTTSANKTNSAGRAAGRRIGRN